jgi:hypothetical protein
MTQGAPDAEVVAPDPKTVRAIPLEALREWYTDRVELSSVRDVSIQAGIGRTTLQNFLNRVSNPHIRIRRRLALYYLKHRG